MSNRALRISVVDMDASCRYCLDNASGDWRSRAAVERCQYLIAASGLSTKLIEAENDRVRLNPVLNAVRGDGPSGSITAPIGVDQLEMRASLQRAVFSSN